jgi:hypothetical protein
MGLLDTLHQAYQNRKARKAKLDPQTPNTSKAKIGKNGIEGAMKRAVPIDGIKPYQVS